MFEKKKSKVLAGKNVSQKKLVTIVSASMLLLTSAVASQTEVVNNAPQETLTQPTISHVLFRVSINRSDEEMTAKEGDLLNIGDIVRTGEDSVARIFFPDGTTQTLCENTTYTVQESGSEFYENDDDPNLRENIIAAFSRCDIKPRFITRCREEGRFFTGTPKAGERGKIGEQVQNSGGFVVKERFSENLVEVTDSVNDTERNNFQRTDYSARCTRGEELYANYVFIPQSVPEPVSVVAPTVPEPPARPVTVPENGGSPVK